MVVFVAALIYGLVVAALVSTRVLAVPAGEGELFRILLGRCHTPMDRL
jgi:hypothetical protein